MGRIFILRYNNAMRVSALLQCNILQVQKGNGRAYIHDSVETIGAIDSFRRFVTRFGTNI